MKTSNSVQENIAELDRLNNILENHLVGGKLTNDGSHLTYIMNENFMGLGGVRVCLSGGKINATKLLIQKLDSLYNREFEWSSNHKKLISV